MTLAAPIVRILIALGVAAALGAACYLVGHAQGYASGKVECAQARTKAAAGAVTQANSALTATRKVEDNHVAKTEKARVVYRTIIRKVHDDARANPDYSTCGLDARGVRLWNAAAAGTLPDTAGDADGGLSAPATTSDGATETGSAAPGGERRRDAREPR